MKFDRKIEKQTLRGIEKLAAKFTRKEVKHACAKWLNGERIKASVAKERERLNQRLAELKGR